MSFPVIDVHAHFLPSFYRDALKAAGHSALAHGLEEWPEWSVQSHLAYMRANTIRKSYLCLSAPGTYLWQPSGNEMKEDCSRLEAAKSLTRQVNEYGLSLKKEYPEQFGFFASLPLPDVDASLEELDWLEAEGNHDGIVLLSNTFGIYLGDSRLERIYARLNEMHTIVFVHPNAPNTNPTSSHSPSLPISPSDSTDQLNPSPTAPLTPAFTFDSTKAFTNILQTHTAANHPHINWLVPHCAFALPTLLPRLLTTPPPNPHHQELTEASLKTQLKAHFHFDLAGLPMSSKINAVLHWADLTQFVFGSDVPFTEWRVAGQLGAQVREELLRIFGMETGVHECMRVCHGNAERLFGLRPRR